MRIPRFIIGLPTALRDAVGVPEHFGEVIPASSELSTDSDKSWPLGHVIQLSCSESHHLLRVLRKKPGDLLEVIDHNSESSYLCCLLGEKGGFAYARLLRQSSVLNESQTHRLTALVAATKPGKCDFIAEKCVELSVHKLVFFIAKRSQLQYKRLCSRLERLERISLSAQKQCGALSAPNILLEQNLEQTLRSLHHEKCALSNLEITDWRFMCQAPERECSEQSKEVPAITAFFSRLSSPPKASGTSLENISKSVDTYLIIGPEGGFTEKETRCAESYGYASVSLGENTLRSETALIAACAVVQLLRAGH